MTMKKVITSVAAAAALTLVVGCSSSSSSNTPTPFYGKLVDGVVSGANYVCDYADTNKTVTNTQGNFYCKNDSVTFSIGGVTLGSVTKAESAGRVVTPGVLAGVNANETNNTKVLAIVRFIKTVSNTDAKGNLVVIKKVAAAIENNPKVKAALQAAITSTETNAAAADDEVTKALTQVAVVAKTEANVTVVPVTKTQAEDHIKATIANLDNYKKEVPAEPTTTGAAATTTGAQ